MRRCRWHRSAREARGASVAVAALVGSGAIAACHRVAPPAPTGPLPTVAVASGAPAGASVDGSAEESGTSVPPPELAESLGGAEADCWGRALDLGRLERCRCRLRWRKLGPGEVSSHNSCSERLYERDLREGLRVSLITERRSIEMGASMRVAVILANETDEPLPIVLRRRPLPPTGRRPVLVAVLDPAGKDWATGGIVSTTSGGMGDYLVVLSPDGEARLSFQWRAVTLVGTATADDTRFDAVPLPPGHYRLVFELAFDESTLLTDEQRLPSAPVEVTAAE